MGFGSLYYCGIIGTWCCVILDDGNYRILEGYNREGPSYVLAIYIVQRLKYRIIQIRYKNIFPFALFV